MTEYTVQANGSKEFQLLANGTVLGHLRYTEWFSLKAVITLANGMSFQIEPRGFWGTTIELKDQEKVLLTFKMHWAGKIIIKSRLDGNKALVFKNKSVLKNTYVLQDKDEQELLLVQPDFHWIKLNHDYTISATELFEQLNAKELLLLTTVHCANYYMMMVASATVVL
ncbi:hypothetical protein HMJ29_00540 [Hymenobacter taeanensis]|uniref:Uncharacterized protein n=1 Tax=Hymenobacter taeanensis TaxID=2735321 RepID=A0A6M6BE95_9BACT|nr:MULTISPECIES: hypothetical protein [Hymenobacter]QJX45505.1 hypothetical protein HMJ29_00540 [Hymenobacter taeanensis]UOQ81248.1 hypothetical protein MUN83_00140 [Hymenobacter sp. 5414T-23]